MAAKHKSSLSLLLWKLKVWEQNTSKQKLRTVWAFKIVWKLGKGEYLQPVTLHGSCSPAQYMAVQKAELGKKIWLFNVLSVLLYWSECWKTTSTIENKLCFPE